MESITLFVLYMHVSLFDWEVHDYEKGTDYYKSLVKPIHLEFEDKQNVGFDEVLDDRLTVHQNELDKGPGSFHNYHTTSLIRSKTSLSDPNYKRHIFNEVVFKTPKISVTSILPKLYLALAKLVKDSELVSAKNIQDNEDRLLSFCRAEIANIRGEMKDTDGHHLETVFEREMEKNNLSYAVHLEKVKGCANEFSDNADDPALNNILQEDDIKEIINYACLSSEMLSNDVEKVYLKILALDKFVKRPLSVDDYPFPAVNIMVPNPNMSVVALDRPDPEVIYKDVDKHLVNHKWKVEMAKMDRQREEDRKNVITRTRRKNVDIPPDVQVWEEYPEFNVLEFVPDEELIRYVCIHDFTTMFPGRNLSRDSYSVFMLKYTELLFTTILIPWILEFG
ncbi:hypothetical protein Ddye_012872 [Dipteronia dyeriana]|uniref:Uncharacterized protein n=1 Tax=Dipteronia dyeriana TaxID=168575 RepID=A0AAD9X5D2_9ROSI|nr:hypothetical protein Ddye_012872 [Dipteronia dyeriana]